MVRVLSLYLDDSGTRHPTRKPGRQAGHGHDWFALGGILLVEEDEETARRVHSELLEKWPQINGAALHSSEIRSKNKRFEWLRGLSDRDAEQFYENVALMMQQAPVVGIACVIDRPGYNARYLEKFEQNPWLLCKSAFAMVVERAAKLAIREERKLRVYVERCNKTEDRLIEGYYRDLRANGNPFAPATSGAYAPLSQAEFHSTLYDLKFKSKDSPLSQIADLYLWPICIGGYHRSNRAFERLTGAGKLVEAHLQEDEIKVLGTKYYCFENVARQP